MPLMEEQRLPEIDFRMDTSERSTAAGAVNNDHDGSDDDEEDVVTILSSMNMNAKRLLRLKSDPILEKSIDDDSSSSTSDDSAQQELEMQLSFLKEKTEACWGKFNCPLTCALRKLTQLCEFTENMKKLPNLSEEIAAMAKTDSGSTSSPSTANTSSADQECDKFNLSVQPDNAPNRKKKRCRSKLVQEFRISVSLLPSRFGPFYSTWCLFKREIPINSHYPKK